MLLYGLNVSLKPIIRVWDDEVAVYLEETRETHLLGVPCLVMLDLLRSGLVSQVQLESELQLLFKGVQPQEIVDLSRQVVDSLFKVGLLEIHESAP